MRDRLRRVVEIERLETLLSAVWGGALQGDSKAIDSAARLTERLSKLKGLDQPTRVQPDTWIEQVRLLEGRRCSVRGWLLRVWPHRFLIMRGTSNCGRCGVPYRVHR